MKLNKIFTLSLYICIISISGAQAMERRPTKKIKPERQEPVASSDMPRTPSKQVSDNFRENLGLYVAKLKQFRSVKLTSDDGQEFFFPEPLINLSSALQQLGQGGLVQSIQLDGMDGITVLALRDLLLRLGFYMHLNIMQPQLYIPRAYQRKANYVLKGKTLTELVKILHAAHSLEIPFIENAVASAIADKVPEDLHDLMLDVLESSDENSDFMVKQSILVERGFAAIAQLPHYVRPWIAKFITHRTRGITEEYSVADFLSAHFAQDIYKPLSYKSMTIVNLKQRDLTSFFGLATLQNPALVAWLVLDNNCFYDPALDPQRSCEPLKNFKKLRKLSLRNCSLRNLPLNMLSESKKLQTLDLQANSLTHLPIGSLEITPHLKNIFI